MADMEANHRGVLSFDIVRDRLRDAFNEEDFQDVEQALKGLPDQSGTVTAVLFLLGPPPFVPGKSLLRSRSEGQGLLLNKRSLFVSQPGDLCFPGGGVHLGLDRIGALMVNVTQQVFKLYPPEWKKIFSLLSSTALREAWEETRLNPFKVKIAGFLPPYKLIMFKKMMVPIVAFCHEECRLKPDYGEVESIIWIPFRELMDPSRYALYRIYDYPFTSPCDKDTLYRDFPCFIHQEGISSEILWGATFNIVCDFMERFFCFKIPRHNHMLIVPGLLGSRYLSKNRS